MSCVRVVGYLSFDRIEFQGRVCDDVPGGAALYAALAARQAGANVSLHAIAGEDFDAALLARLAQIGIDLSQIQRAAGKTRRARLAYSTADLRTNAHHGADAWWERTRALAPPVPANLAAGDVVALMAVPGATAAATLDAARLAGARVAMDTSAAFAARECELILAVCGGAHVFAPSLEETRLLCPDMSDDAAAVRLAASGCNVLQKRGADGAFAVAAHRDSGTRLAAPPTAVLDPTGAGDATLGGLAAALAAGLDFMSAARAALASGAACVRALGASALGLDFRTEGAR